MARCPRCKQDMSEVVACVPHALTVSGEHYTPVPFGEERRYRRYGPWPRGEECHDCGTSVGGLHHLSCDVEECPRCRGQLISCDCE